MSTACHPIHDAESARNPNVVKVVLDKESNALYFSRAPIPYARTQEAALPENLTALRHIGIYAYRAGFLRAFHQLSPAAIEQIEALEQLRVLWHGYKIGVVVSAQAAPGGVDTEQDLLTVRKLFEPRNRS